MAEEEIEQVFEAEAEVVVVTLLCIAHIATNLGILISIVGLNPKKLTMPKKTEDKMTTCLWSRQKQRKQQMMCGMLIVAVHIMSLETNQNSTTLIGQ